MRILHMDSDIPSVYFPIGKPEDGGTCFAATKKCIEYCPSGMEINEHERFALRFFQNNNPLVITMKMIKDFGYLANRPYNAKMIQWFVWGDCLPELTEKIADVIFRLRDEGIPQYGFTRNVKLWEKIPKEDRLSLGLTIDDMKKAKQTSLSSKKMIAHPDFETGYAEMVFRGEVKSRCNGWWCKTEIETRNSDCTRCLNHGEGCYFR